MVLFGGEVWGCFPGWCRLQGTNNTNRCSLRVFKHATNQLETRDQTSLRS